MNLLLDTTILVDVLRDRNHRRRLVDEWVSAGHILGTSAINIAEVYAGARPGEERKIDYVLSTLECYPATATIGRAAGEWKVAQARIGRTVGFADALIAATAVNHGLIVVTDNRKHFTMPGLDLFPLP